MKFESRNKFIKFKKNAYDRKKIIIQRKIRERRERQNAERRKW